MNDKTKKTAATPSPTRAELDAAIGELPGEYRDAEYVVNALRIHFGDLFTLDDEAKVRGLVKAGPPSTPPPPAATGASAGAGQQASQVKPGDVVTVLDWTRDPNAPVECRGIVASANRDGTTDVAVEPPAGIEPYTQTGLTECTAGNMKPGQFRRT